jgi:hypothetical protein
MHSLTTFKIEPDIISKGAIIASNAIIHRLET